MIVEVIVAVKMEMLEEGISVIIVEMYGGDNIVRDVIILEMMAVMKVIQG